MITLNIIIQWYRLPKDWGGRYNILGIVAFMTGTSVIGRAFLTGTSASSVGPCGRNASSVRPAFKSMPAAEPRR